MNKLLWNPFERIAGLKALFFGMVLMLVGAVMAVICNARFDGVLDLHFATGESNLKPFTDQLFNWVILTLVFYLAALVSGARPRLVDIAGTFALARAPFTLLPLINVSGFISDISVRLMSMEKRQEFPLSTGETVPFVALICLVLLAAIWLVVLYFKAYKTCSNLKGGKLTLSFISALIISEIISVYVIRILFNY
jgi:hypothetical protein